MIADAAEATQRVAYLRDRLSTPQMQLEQTKAVLASDDDSAGHTRRLGDFLDKHPEMIVTRFEISDGRLLLGLTQCDGGGLRKTAAFRDALELSPFRRRLQLAGIQLAPIEVTFYPTIDPGFSGGSGPRMPLVLAYPSGS